MLPRLQAEESLRAFQRIGAGTGSFGEAGREITAGWRDEMEDAPAAPPGERPRLGDPLKAPSKASLARLSKMGYAVILEPKKPKPADAPAPAPPAAPAVGPPE